MFGSNTGNDTNTVKFQFKDQEGENFYNILAGRLFKDNFKKYTLSIHVKGIQLPKKFIDERHQKK